MNKLDMIHEQMTEPTAKTLDARGRKYGDYRTMAACAQELKAVLRRHNAMVKEPYMQESLDMICLKIARILVGDPAHFDSWHDIEGYAHLVAERLTPETRP